ncbi:hypothetical protein M1N56_05340 [Dehalococcoidia bacterium]|nr:hypothetical protein [Dehalococcoidia bacterium]
MWEKLKSGAIMAGIAAAIILFTGFCGGVFEICTVKDGRTICTPWLVEILQDEPIGYLIYVGEDNEIHSIYAVDDTPRKITAFDGDGKYTLTNPVLAPSHGKLAFLAEEYSKDNISDENPDGVESKIFVIHSDGTNLAEVVSSKTKISYISWSPDSTKIAYDVLSPSFEVATDIWVVNEDGTNPTKLTGIGSGPKVDLNVWPVWSPDGTQIVYLGATSESINLYLMNANGLNKRKLTNVADGLYANGVDFPPSWSPHNNKIAFSASQGDKSEIFVIDADGNNRIKITDTSTMNFGPVWSPVEDKIAFESYNEVNEVTEIYVVGLDSTGPIQLSPDYNMGPYDGITWSPDGKRVAYVDHMYGADNFIVVSELKDKQEDVENPEILIRGSFPDWSPRSPK